MTTLDKIRKNIRRGDLKVIASLSGYSYIYVRKVMSGERVNDTILEVASEMIKNREKMEARIKSKQQRS